MARQARVTATAIDQGVRMPDAPAPLAGIRIIDLTSNMSGPLATMVLADQGADVIKVEPPSGDAIRSVGTGHAGMSAYFANNNRGKRSIAINLSTEAGRDIVRRLASGADVFAQNFRPGVIDRLGLDAGSLMAANPRLVYASISGFGTDGPLAGAPAYDHVVQALAGYAAIQSAGTSEPSMVRHGVVDKATAYTLAQAVTAALLQRERTGRGTQIDVSMLDVAIAFLWPDGMMDHTVDEPSNVLPPTSRSFRVTPTADGQVVLVTLTASQWGALTGALLDDGEAGDMTDTSARMKGGAEVMRRVRGAIASMPTDEVVARLRAADVPVAPVRQLDEVADDPQVVACGTVRAFEHDVLGKIHQPRPAPYFGGATIAPTPSAPPLGQHTDEVLRDAGWSDADIADLRAEGIVH
jgi:crotonobetainyl-CoA:carnitine CoA-transferase CaiB-like acyl-CoA transferase